jgi:hypothetical protein
MEVQITRPVCHSHRNRHAVCLVPGRMARRPRGQQDRPTKGRAPRAGNPSHHPGVALGAGRPGHGALRVRRTRGQEPPLDGLVLQHLPRRAQRPCREHHHRRVRGGELSANSRVCFSVSLSKFHTNVQRPILVNVSSFRCIIGFAMSFKATTWIEELGFLASFSIYAGVLAFFVCMLPIFYIYGKRIRRWTSGTVASPHT